MFCISSEGFTDVMMMSLLVVDEANFIYVYLGIGVHGENVKKIAEIPVA